MNRIGLAFFRFWTQVFWTNNLLVEKKKGFEVCSKSSTVSFNMGLFAWNNIFIRTKYPGPEDEATFLESDLHQHYSSQQPPSPPTSHPNLPKMCVLMERGNSFSPDILCCVVKKKNPVNYVTVFGVSKARIIKNGIIIGKMPMHTKLEPPLPGIHKPWGKGRRRSLEDDWVMASFMGVFCIVCSHFQMSMHKRT